MRILKIAALTPLFLVSPANVNADANDGELFGFSLGANYAADDQKAHDDGRLVLIATHNPVKPDAINTVYVLVTPLSRTVGKIAGESWFESGEDAIVAYERFRSILRNKYAGWQSEERSDVHYQATRFLHQDYALSVQVSGPHRDNSASQPDKPFQLVLTLAYQAATPSAIDFEMMASEEIRQAAVSNAAEEDVRGL